MASFTDQISQFNPYISQLPIQAMTEVGQWKQQQYDQGVQKIQTQIDNVAGMDIANESQKKYLQSKLDDLGNNLRTVAAGDFSNQQLVNSVGGMATSIIKDPIVQNAAASTQRLKQGVSDKQAANKSGKGSVDNDWFFDQGANAYLSNTDVNASYSGGYIEHRDLQPKMIEVLKSLHESGSDTEVPWKTDKDGNILYGDTAKAMVENGFKGITSAKIENAIRSSLDANDLRQMQISGMYQFRNYTQEDLANHAQDQYKAGIQTVTDKIAALQKYAATNSANANIVNQSKTAIAELQKQIGEGGAYRGELTQKLNNQLAAIARDPNQVKADLYKEGAIKEFANSHSWEETVLKYVNNPILDADHWTADYGLKAAAQKETRRHNLAEEALSGKKYDLDFWVAHGGTGEPFVAVGGNEQPVKKPEDIVNGQVATYTNAATAGVSALAAKIQENARKLGPDKTVVVTPTDVENMINGSYHGPIKNPIGPEYKAAVNSILENRRQAGLNAAVLNTAHEQVENDPEMKNLQNQITQSIAGQKSITIKDESGRNVTFTPRELFDFAQKPVTKTISGGISSAGIPIDKTVEDLNRLTEKEKLLYKNYNNVSSILGTPIQNWANPIIAKKQEALNKYNKRYNEIIASKTPQYAPTVTPIDTPSPTAQSRWSGIADALSKVDRHDVGGYDNWNNSKVNSWLADKSIAAGLKYGIYNDGVTKQLWVTGPDGSVQKRTLSYTDIAQLPEAQTSNAAQIKGEMMMTGGTTNAANESPEGAKWQQSAFPLAKRITVVGDLHEEYGNNNKVFPKIQIKTKDGWMPIQIDKGMSIDKASEFFSGLDDASIIDIIRHYNPNFKGKLF